MYSKVWRDKTLMRHPEALLIPIFMLFDYYLTIWGAILAEKKYRHHFKIEYYELNPIWQQAIARKRWFNPRHLLMTIVIGGALVYVAEIGPTTFSQWLLGILLVLYGMIIGKHLSNILLFRYVMKRTESLNGAVTMSHPLILTISIFQTIAFLIPFILLVLFSPSAFIIGGLCGLFLFLGIQSIWLWRAKRRIRNRPIDA